MRIAAPALALMLCMMVSSGCSSMGKLLGMRDRADDYLLARTEERLQVPSDLSPVERQNIEHIPASNNLEEPQNGGSTVSMPPPLINPALGDVVIQSLQGRSWLLLELPVAQVWPRLRGFITLNSIPINRIESSHGIVETNWLRLSEGQIREKFLFTLSPGLRANTSELHIIQADERAGEAWPEVSHSGKRANNMLKNFAVYMANLGNQPLAVSLRASSRLSDEGPRMAVLTDEQQRPIIVLAVSYARAWAATGLALEKSGIYLMDRNRDNGVFHIAYDPDKKVRKPKKTRSRRRRSGQDLPLPLPPKPPDAKALAKITRKLPKFRLRLENTRDNVRIIPIAEDPNTEPEIARLLMRQLASFLS